MDKKHKPYTIVFIESNTTGSGEKFIEAAINKNFHVLFLTANPAKYSFIKKYLLHPIILDTLNLKSISNYLQNVPNIKAVISTSENFIYNASYIAKQLSLPGAKPTSIENCRNKFLLGTILAKANLPSITTKIISECEEILPALKNLTFPIVVKPNCGTGSVGVKLCTSTDEVINHYKKLNDTILLQEYILGEEYSAEILAFENRYHLLGITKKYLSQAPYFVEIAHEFPASIDYELKNEIFTTMIKALQAVDFTFGPVHIEFRLAKQKIYIIEINPRLAGGMIPTLIEQSQQIMLIDNLLNLYLDTPTDFAPKTSFATKIAFILPQMEGQLLDVSGLDLVKKQTNIFDIQMYKNNGDEITLKGDFSDRIGYIIAKSPDLDCCRKAVSTALQTLQLNISADTQKHNQVTNHARDRLNIPLDPRVKKILAGNSSNELSELVFLSKINKAHILMLHQCHIISTIQAKKMAEGVVTLEQDNFFIVKQFYDASVGYYLSYEQALIDNLGVNIAGNIHVGRSRNDINATIQRFKSREIFIRLYSTLWQLRSVMLQVAAKSLDVPMPVYSQYQPAMPATYAYYLFAIENSLALSQYNLAQVIAIVNTATLGAAAGAGTTFPINPDMTAKLLGFDNSLFNALTAVSSRDLEMMLLSSGAMLGITISRIAQDYQLWTTLEFGLIDLPDSLCGISSSMPQKKNPYLLEKIKGKAMSIIGALNSAFAVMGKTPFTNSVEVGTEALTNYLTSLDELIKAMQLLEIIVQEAKPIPKNIRRSNLKGLTVATAVAELLTKNNPELSYREAHAIVGKTIMNAINNQQEPLDEILKLEKTVPTNPDEWALLFEYGSGPGKAATQTMLAKAKTKLNSDADFFRAASQKWQKADDSLAKELQGLQQ